VEWLSSLHHDTDGDAIPQLAASIGVAARPSSG